MASSRRPRNSTVCKSAEPAGRARDTRLHGGPVSAAAVTVLDHAISRLLSAPQSFPRSKLRYLLYSRMRRLWRLCSAGERERRSGNLINKILRAGPHLRSPLPPSTSPCSRSTPSGFPATRVHCASSCNHRRDLALATRISVFGSPCLGSSRRDRGTAAVAPTEGFFAILERSACVGPCERLGWLRCRRRLHHLRFRRRPRHHRAIQLLVHHRMKPAIARG
jgi:hypothetical protein